MAFRRFPLLVLLALAACGPTGAPEQNASSNETIETVDVPHDCAIFQNGHPRKCRYRL